MYVIHPYLDKSKTRILRRREYKILHGHLANRTATSLPPNYRKQKLNGQKKFRLQAIGGVSTHVSAGGLHACVCCTASLHATICRGAEVSYKKSAKKKGTTTLVSVLCRSELHGVKECSARVHRVDCKWRWPARRASAYCMCPWSKLQAAVGGRKGGSGVFVGEGSPRLRDIG